MIRLGQVDAGALADKVGLRIPTDLIIQAIREIELLTEAPIPPVKVSMKDVLTGGTGSARDWPPELRMVKPTLTLRGELIGTRVWAPVGRADPEAWKRNLALAAGIGIGGALLILGLTFAAGYSVGKRRALRG